MTKTKRVKIRAPKLKKFKLKAQPLSEDQIEMFVKHYDKYKSFPGSKIPCVLTGKLTTCTGPWLKKKVKQFGSAEALLRNYACRQATKKAVVRSIGKKKKENVIAKQEGRYDIPTISFTPPRPLNETELAKDSEDICLRPDIFIANGRHCDGCPYYKICRNDLKNLPKHISFDGTKFISTEIKKKKS